MNTVFKLIVAGLIAVLVPVVPLAAVAQPSGPQLPPGAVVERTCLPGYGQLAYLSKDVPFGPYYGVYQGKLIFTEYKVTLQEAQQGRLTNLKSVTGPVDSVDMLWRPRGHQGFEVPHFDVFLWNIPPSERQAIRCP
jgi:hypothetical protein